MAANRDAEPHTVTAVDGSFDSGPIGSGLAVSFAAPAAPGTYAFVCTIHPSMTGQLVVGLSHPTHPEPIPTACRTSAQHTPTKETRPMFKSRILFGLAAAAGLVLVSLR